MVWEHAELYGKLRQEKVIEIYGSCARKIRNMLEGMYHKKSKKKKKVSLKLGRNREAAMLAVRDGLVAAGDDQMAEEIFKTWLYGKTDMLKKTLDFFEIPNDDGMTEADLDPLEQASTEKIEELLGILVDSPEGGFDLEDVAIYLAFMKIENITEVSRISDVFSSNG